MISLLAITTELIEQTFNREGSLCLACNEKRVLFNSEQPKNCGHARKFVMLYIISIITLSTVLF